MRNYKELKIWQKADELASLVYSLALMFPKEELFGLTSQVKRSALAVPANIVEGFYRGRREFLHFLVIALSSLKETDYLLNFAVGRAYCQQQDAQAAFVLIDELSKMISVFIKKLKG